MTGCREPDSSATELSAVETVDLAGVQHRRFIAVFFTDWLVDLESVLIRRALFHIGVRQWAHPLVVVTEQNRVQRVVGCCDLALAAGARVGMTVSQAESVCPVHALHGGSTDAGGPDSGGCCPGRDGVERLRQGAVGASRALGGRNWAERIVSNSDRMLAVRHDPEISARALERLARCLERWIPDISLSGNASLSGNGGDALVVGDFTGCSELFRGVHGTEQRFMRRVAASLGKRGFRAQVATASTIGAAVAVARWMSDGLSRRKRGCVGVARGAEQAFIETLPIEALRITPATAEAMRSVEVATIGDVIRLQQTARGRRGIAERLSGVARPPDGDGAVSPSRSRPSSRGPTRSRHVATTGGWHGTPSLFASPVAEVSDSVAHREHPRRHVRCMDDLLLRLDQALGIEPESVVPMRFSDPVVLERIFEAPCSRIEAIFIACGELVDRLVAALAARREGLRSATWTFRHAELPADLSTDVSPRVSTPPRVSISPRVSRIELGLSKPSVSRSHMWTVLRSRLERLALDHGVEAIECRVERTARLRMSQVRLLSVGEVQWSPSARGEWLDMVASRLGLSSVCTAGGADSAVELDIAVHRPHAFLERPEVAQLGAGAQSESLAHALATRTVWSSGGDDAWFGWRGHRWPLLAVDGWERDADPWWRSAPRSAAAVSAAVTPNMTTDAAACGRVHSRVQIANGLWLFVRWPTRLPRMSRGRAPRDGAHPGAAWLAGSAAALAAGIDLEVLGAWG